MMTVRIGFVGVGGMAQKHMDNISKMEGAEIAAVCDISETALNAAVSKYDAKGYLDYRSMIDSESLDGIIVAVPPFAHTELEDEVIERGIHLLVEKPVELDLEAAKRKYAKIKKAGIINASGYCLRYLDFSENVKTFLADKKIGMALAFRLGKPPAMPWYGDISNSGGQLVEAATHQVDLMRYFIGDITEVYSKMKLRHLDYLDNFNIYDVGTTTLEFANGAIGSIATSLAQQQESRQIVEIMGENFRVGITSKKITIVEKGKPVVELEATVNMVQEEDRRFIEAIRTGNQSLILADYGEGLKTLAVTLAANLSAETGCPIRISDGCDLSPLFGERA